MPHTDFYEVLGVDRSASQQEIRRAYRRLVRELHPDSPEAGSASADRLGAVFEAYAVLGHPHRRAAYDQALRRAEAAFSLWAGMPEPRSSAWPPRSVFDEPDPDLLRILFRWFP
ncbi:DnaJ domain-containing protein [Sinomonas susongensis]|uniref:DnaJ domain-containing protein n=1 Tax=Sinomonas susongensis TaxID=1324851 RepID=UPI00110903FC|nr:DnaJ domain-containing protein [Sinomonas susongensis]